jgi:Tol biopolymer transport system component
MSSGSRIGRINLLAVGFFMLTALGSWAFHAKDAPCVVGSVENLGPGANDPSFDGSPTVLSSERVLFLTSNRANGQEDIFVSTRQRRSDLWGEAVNIGPPVNTPDANENGLRLSLDGKSLYFSSNRPGGFGSSDLYVATRQSKNHPWSSPVNLGPLINTEIFEGFPTPSADGNTLYFNRSTTASSPDGDIWITTRLNAEEPWGIPEPLPQPVNGPSGEFAPSISTDGLRLYFASQRPGNIGFLDIWMARRTSVTGAWEPAENLGPDVNAPFSVTLAPFISVDGRNLYFMSTRPGGFGQPGCGFFNCFDLYVATFKCGD